MFAGNPFWIHERQGPRRNRNRHACVKQFAGRSSGIDAECNGRRWWASDGSPGNNDFGLKENERGGGKQYDAKSILHLWGSVGFGKSHDKPANGSPPNQK